jgi:AP-1-like factor
MKQRRRAQNRASQRAYRARKDRRTQELEIQLKEMGDQNESLKRDHAELCAAHEKLQREQSRWRTLRTLLEKAL